MNARRGERRWAVFHGIGYKYIVHMAGRMDVGRREFSARVNESHHLVYGFLAFGVAAGTKDARRQGRGFGNQPIWRVTIW